MSTHPHSLSLPAGVCPQPNAPIFAVVRMTQLDQAHLIYTPSHVHSVTQDDKVLWLNADQLEDIGLWEEAVEVHNADVARDPDRKKAPRGH